jgi:hypothetical protein
MYRGSRFSIAIGLSFLACFGPAAYVSEAQAPQGVIEGLFPTQLAPGQTIVLNAGVPGRNEVTGAEVSPATGVTVSGIKRGEVKQGITWWDISVMVARDAAPGARTLMLTGPMVRTAPRTLTVEAHVPTISDLRILAAPMNQSPVNVQFAAADPAGDLGEAVNVWFTLACGGEPEVGVVKGKVANGVVRASIPNPRTMIRPGAAAVSPGVHCELQVRASDSKQADSNTLKTVVDFK